MLFSKSFIFTSRQDPKIAECKSHKLLLKGCFLFMLSSGIYSYLPLGWRVLKRISDIIRKYMDMEGAQELIMSSLQPIEIWEKTGRDKDLEEVMFKFKDRKERTLCLGPTHEEVITEIARKHISSYKQMPFTLYQIQTKFRDEPRPRFGLMRSCEFLMKDAYSFDVDEHGLEESYKKMLTAYQNIFKECSLNYVLIEAEPGVMGGNISHEFMVPAPIGEDILLYCSVCNKYYRPKEVQKIEACPECGSKLGEHKMVEIGHIFKLGTKYSLTQEAFFLDKNGERKPIIMGCYGIGVSRLLAAIVEQEADDKGIIWPKNVSPFNASIVVLENNLFEQAVSLEEILEKTGLSILLDDRNEGAGVKFNDAYLIGSPFIIVMGKNYLKTGKIDVEIRKTKAKLSFTQEEVINFLKNEYGVF